MGPLSIISNRGVPLSKIYISIKYPISHTKMLCFSWKCIEKMFKLANQRNEANQMKLNFEGDGLDRPKDLCGHHVFAYFVYT